MLPSIVEWGSLMFFCSSGSVFCGIFMLLDSSGCGAHLAGETSVPCKKKKEYLSILKQCGTEEIQSLIPEYSIA